MRRRHFAFLCICFTLFSLIPASAQERSLFWQKWDVLIDQVDVTRNQFQVTEIYDVAFTGTFSFGTRVIPLRNLEDIQNIAVTDGGRALRRECNTQPGTYCVQDTDAGRSIRYYFFSPVTNGIRKIEIGYLIVGGLRIYEEGDQLWWDAIPEEHFGFSIESSTVIVRLPTGYAPREGIDSVVSYGAPTQIDVNGTSVTARATRTISGNEALSLRVQYPHNADARVAAWQSDFDAQSAFDQNVRPLIDLGVIVLSLVIGLGGSLFVIARWQTRGRDPAVGVVPEFLSDLPSNLPPALVGTLIDETADLRDVMSTLLDLASRGYLVIEETQTEGLFGIGMRREFTFKRTDKTPDDLRPYEQRLLNNVFAGRQLERTLASMRNTFYAVIPQIQSDLYQELVTQGFFIRSPQATRMAWSVGGSTLLFLAIGGCFLLVLAESNLPPSVFCLPFAIGLVSVIMLIFARAMPAKTRKGAEENAKWSAFLKYLQNVEQYGNLDAAKSQFERYLPYTVAFGLERTWIGRFKGLTDMPIPNWYFPTYLGGPYGRGYIPGTPMPGALGGGVGVPGDLARAGGGDFSFDALSGNLASGLEGISSGLTQLVESASSVMTSRPQQSSGSGSWSSGGGGFSGGGGGGSGGGSSGFG